ncbi:MAG: LLM class flavin-dependent oxidoreductase [Chloroflexi bacterium]|nr:MAG: LLM class flavin-dependent oxidoreductase [Chloroflexota bacterium]
MKYGVYLPNFGPFGDANMLANLAFDAEEAGWDGFFIWDHIAGWSLNMVDPWVALAAIALRTTTIRMGTTVSPLPRRRPWKVAREAVSIDRLANGRFTLSVGIGLGDDEWGKLGEERDQKIRGAMLDEALQVVTGLWQGEPFSYDGEHYQIQDAHFLPKPVQSPRIPIWVGGFWPNKRPFQRAARWDGMFPLFQTDDFEEIWAQLETAVQYVYSQRQSDESFDVVCTGVTHGEDAEKDAEWVANYQSRGCTWWLEGIAPYRYGQGFDEPWPLEKMRQRVLQGPPL